MFIKHRLNSNFPGLLPSFAMVCQRSPVKPTKIAGAVLLTSDALFDVQTTVKALKAFMR